jgi:hypothetical protein
MQWPESRNSLITRSTTAIMLSSVPQQASTASA